LGIKPRSIVLLLGIVLLLLTSPRGQGQSQPRPEERLASLLELTTPPDPLSNRKPLELPDHIALSREALNLARSLRKRDLEARALFHLSAGYRLNREIPQALEAVYQAREIYGQIPDPSGRALMEAELGHIFQNYLSDHATALGYYRKALETARKAGLTHLIIKNLTYIGNIYSALGEYETAAASLTEALPLGETSKDYSDQMAAGVVLVRLSQIQLQLGDISSAQHFLERARLLFDRPGYYREYGASRVLIQAGLIHRHQKQFGEALAQYQAALELRLRLGNASDRAYLHYLMGETEREAGRPGEALLDYQKALAFRRETHDQLGIAQTTLGLGQALAALRRESEALPHLEESLEISRSQGFGKEQKDVYLALSEVHAAQGRAAEALRYRRLFDEWKDKVQGSKVTAAVLATVNRYEKDQLNRELKLLKKKHGWTVWAYSAALLILLSLVALLVFNYRRLREWARRVHQKKSATIQHQRARMEDLQSRVEEIESDLNKPKYSSSNLSEEQAQASIRKLMRLMEQEQLYRDSELSLDLLAQRLNLNANYLSQILNQHLNRKFSEFINDYRIEEAKRLLGDPELIACSALDIGLRAGFGAKSSYYRLFKEATGLTPVEYRRANLPPDMETGEF